jgi:hypothetical protein
VTPESDDHVIDLWRRDNPIATPEMTPQSDIKGLVLIQCEVCGHIVYRCDSRTCPFEAHGQSYRDILDGRKFVEAIDGWGRHGACACYGGPPPFHCRCREDCYAESNAAIAALTIISVLKWKGRESMGSSFPTAESAI